MSSGIRAIITYLLLFYFQSVKSAGTPTSWELGDCCESHLLSSTMLNKNVNSFVEERVALNVHNQSHTPYNAIKSICKDNATSCYRGENTIMIITNSDRKYANFIKYWGRRLESMGLHNYLIECTDLHCYTACVRDLSIHHCTNFTQFTASRNQLDDLKAALLLSAVSKGYDVLYSEMDVYWNSNILVSISNLIREHDPIDVLMSGHYYCPTVNIGLMYIKSTKSTIEFLQSYYGNVSTLLDPSKKEKGKKRNIYLNDQNIFDSLLCNIHELIPRRFLNCSKGNDNTTTIYTKSGSFRWMMLPFNRFGSFRAIPACWGHGVQKSQLHSLHLTNLNYSTKADKLIGYYNISHQDRQEVLDYVKQDEILAAKFAKKKAKKPVRNCDEFIDSHSRNRSSSYSSRNSNRSNKERTTYQIERNSRSNSPNHNKRN